MEEDWIEMSARGPRKNKDEAAVVFIEAGSPGVIEEDTRYADGRLLSHSTWTGADESVSAKKPSTVSEMKAFVPAGRERMLPEIAKRLKRIGWHFESSPHKAADWREKWKEGLKPVKITSAGASVIIKPSWCKIKKTSGVTVIDIDPGMAFGTGGHATTKMCIKATLALLGGRDSALLKKGYLDVGTGTGVLAIAAKKLGVERSVGIDIDPEAVKSARKNARINKTKATFGITPIDRQTGAFPIVAANILATDLKRICPYLYKKTMPLGRVILSGILKIEASDVRKVFADAGFVFEKGYSSGEWAAIVMKKKSCEKHEKIL